MFYIPHDHVRCWCYDHPLTDNFSRSRKYDEKYKAIIRTKSEKKMLTSSKQHIRP